MDQIPLPERNVQTRGQRFVQDHRSFCVIFHNGAAGNHILLFKNAVEKLQRQPGHRILQAENQAFGSAAVIISCRKTGKPVCSMDDLMTHIPELRAEAPVRILERQAAHPIVPRVASGILLTDIVQGEIFLVHQLIGIAGESAVGIIMHIFHMARPHLPSIIKVVHISAAVRLDLIRSAGRVQIKGTAFLFKQNTHFLLRPAAPRTPPCGCGILSG